jgi:hypothetical protein
MDVTEGTTYRISYPFHRVTYTVDDIDGPYTIPSWSPGTVQNQDYSSGVRILTCLAIVQLPSPYRPKVLYVQTWQDPDGKVFGNRKVRVCSIPKFTGFLHGYRFPYIITL